MYFNAYDVKHLPPQILGDNPYERLIIYQETLLETNDRPCRGKTSFSTGNDDPNDIKMIFDW